jgi:hypothetical protein
MASSSINFTQIRTNTDHLVTGKKVYIARKTHTRLASRRILSVLSSWEFTEGDALGIILVVGCDGL